MLVLKNMCVNIVSWHEVKIRVRCIKNNAIQINLKYQVYSIFFFLIVVIMNVMTMEMRMEVGMKMIKTKHKRWHQSLKFSHSRLYVLLSLLY